MYEGIYSEWGTYMYSKWGIYSNIVRDVTCMRVYEVRSKRPCERGWGAWRSRPPCGSGRTPRPERGCQRTPVEWPAAGLGRSASNRLLLCTVYTHIHTTGTVVCMLISYIRSLIGTIVYLRLVHLIGIPRRTRTVYTCEYGCEVWLYPRQQQHELGYSSK